MDPLLNSTIAKTGAWNFLYILIWSIKYIYLSYFFHSVFLLSPSFCFFPVLASLPCLFRPSCCFFHSFTIFSFPSFIKILAIAKYSCEDEHLHFTKFCSWRFMYIFRTVPHVSRKNMYTQKIFLVPPMSLIFLYLYVFLMYSHELSWQDAISVADLSRVSNLWFELFVFHCLRCFCACFVFF